ncbi:MAG: CPBP family intramembrane metalloprotease, partial [Treponema sp.]|nr:CPBP family intramembrane metalloprotease [Treponema sp.]
MSMYAEALIFYAVLFLSGSVNRGEGQAAFSPMTEIARILVYHLPAIALVWYSLLKRKRLRDWGVLPGAKDLLSLVILLPCLLITSFIIVFASSFIVSNTPHTTLHSPSTVVGWIILSVSCLTTGYLEESFFRLYLLARRSEFRLTAPAATVFSVVLFSICHIYEGPWGFLNSVLSGTLFSFVFLRY